jgi:tetratricopeptide (TPR) repeat protein
MSKKSSHFRNSPPQSTQRADSAATLRQAIQLHQNGHLDRARALYGKVLDADPENFDALHLSGVIAAQKKDPANAIVLIDLALRADGANPAAHAAHRNRGLALMTLGRLEAALASFDQAILIQPNFAEAHCDRGIVLHRLRRLDAAAESFNQAVALRPQLVEAHVGLGTAYHESKRLDAALYCYDRALGIDPKHAVAHSNRGVVLNDLGRADAALVSCHRAVELKPDHAEGWFNRGNVQKDLRQFEAALASYDRGLALKPDSAAAHANRGALLTTLGRWDAALESCERAIALAPDHAQAHSNRGNVLREMNRWEVALASHDRAIALQPGHAKAHANRGVLLLDLQRLDDALASFDRAIAIDPEYANAHFNRSLCHLLAANWRDGWAGFEWRLKGSQGMKGPKRAFTAPRWCGTEPLAGKSIVIHSEQGLGDTIQFVRYAKLLANRGARVILEVQRPLLLLLADVEGVAQVAATGDKLPPHDLHCPLLSLPLAFVAGTIAIPAEIPYIKADPQRVGDWKMRLGERRKPRVGIAWSGGFRPDQPELWSVNSRRNIPLQKLAPLKDLDIEFYSLQKGEPAESELKAAASSNWGGPAMHDFAGLLEDFADTAALIENLDLVVSVDTSTAHLAGAMGKPVWMLNRFDTCWRWLLHRCDTPWYPTMRLYRQATPGDWDTVVQRVKADLGAFQDGRSLPSSNDSTLG